MTTNSEQLTWRCRRDHEWLLERLHSLDTAWGGVRDARSTDPVGDERFLNGPALDGEGHDQAGIDALFDDARPNAA